MDLPLTRIYSSALRGIRDNLLVYILLLVWGLTQAIVLVALLGLGSVVWITSMVAIASSPNPGSAGLYITSGFIAALLVVLAILSAATRAGVLCFGSKIRKGLKAGPLDFFRGIIRFTVPLFVGGIVVGMLSCIPLLGFLLFARWSLAGTIADIFTSGWNFEQSIIFLRYIWNMMLVFGMFQVAIFFWIAPWDEMVVLYEVPYPEALLRSFTFVFSRRHFLRVVGLVVANVLIAQLILILSNIGVFIEGLEMSPGIAYVRVLASSSSSSITSFLQFVLYPFFAYSQLYLLPWPQKQEAVDWEREARPVKVFNIPTTT